MIKFLYINSNKSGIGDRIHDIILIYTYAKYLKHDSVYLNWINNCDINGNSIHSRMRREKTPFRKEDYLLENLRNYIILPEDIYFVQNYELYNMVNDNNATIFNDYLGLQYSVYTFINKYLPNLDIYNKEKFIDSYFDNFKKIKFKNIPENIIDTFKNNEIITIHIRRGDKMNDNCGAANGINFNEIVKLNYKTDEFIDACLSQKYFNICFVSDEQSIKNEYIEKYKDKCNIINFQGNSISQTYYDIYCIAHAKKILLSQRFSVFSILGSLIHGNTLYYIFEDGKIINDDFKNYCNIKYYKSIINQL